MSETTAVVVWSLALLVLPAAVMIITALMLLRQRTAAGRDRRGGRGGLIVATVALGLAALPALIVLVRETFAPDAFTSSAQPWWLSFWLGLLLLPVSGILLAWADGPIAGGTLIGVGIVLPVVVYATGNFWLLDDMAGEPTPQSVSFGTIAVVLLFGAPAFFSGLALTTSPGSRTSVNA